MYTKNDRIEGFDDELHAALGLEERRQEDHIELIASENYASPRVLEAQGSVLTNKYAEGYPGKRYYGGCEHVDVVERLAIDRVKKLFGADYANVQPHSGSQANAAVYMALVKPGDTVLGMSLAHGGHLTHGAKVSFSGKLLQRGAVRPRRAQRRNRLRPIHIGTPAVTTRGFGTDDVGALAHWICDLLTDLRDEVVLHRIRGQVAALCARHPVYREEPAAAVRAGLPG